MDKQTLRILAALARRRARRPRTYTPTELRAAWVEHWRSVERKRRKWERFEMVGPFWPRPLPEALRGLTCGAKTKDGTPCECQILSKRNGRCWAHGGASTGPRTPEGKAKVAANGGLVRMWEEIKGAGQHPAGQPTPGPETRGSAGLSLAPIVRAVPVASAGVPILTALVG